MTAARSGGVGAGRRVVEVYPAAFAGRVRAAWAEHQGLSVGLVWQVDSADSSVATAD